MHILSISQVLPENAILAQHTKHLGNHRAPQYLYSIAQPFRLPILPYGILCQQSHFPIEESRSIILVASFFTPNYELLLQAQPTPLLQLSMHELETSLQVLNNSSSLPYISTPVLLPMIALTRYHTTLPHLKLIHCLYLPCNLFYYHLYHRWRSQLPSSPSFPSH